MIRVSSRIGLIIAMVPRSEDPCQPGLSKIALQARLLRYCGMGPFVLSCVVSRLVVSPCLLACSHLVNNAWLAVSATELLFLSLTKKTKTSNFLLSNMPQKRCYLRCDFTKWDPEQRNWLWGPHCLTFFYDRCTYLSWFLLLYLSLC